MQSDMAQWRVFPITDNLFNAASLPALTSTASGPINARNMVIARAIGVVIGCRTIRPSTVYPSQFRDSSPPPILYDDFDRSDVCTPVATA